MTPQTFNNGSRGENSNISKMIILSLLIHVFVISTAIITVPTTSRSLTFGQAYSVQLVGPEVMLPTKDTSVLNDILQPTEAANPIIVKKEVSGLSSTPVKKEDISKLEVEKAISALRQKENSTPQVAQEAKPSTAANAPAGGGNVPQGQAGSLTDEYCAFIQSKIKRNWSLPQALIPKDNIETIIEVKILRNGEVERLAFGKRSGNNYVDDSLMRAVQKSRPFPPFPIGMMENYIERGIRFRSSDLR